MLCPANTFRIGASIFSQVDLITGCIWSSSKFRGIFRVWPMCSLFRSYAAVHSIHVPDKISVTGWLGQLQGSAAVKNPGTRINDIHYGMPSSVGLVVHSSDPSLFNRVRPQWTLAHSHTRTINRGFNEKANLWLQVIMVINPVLTRKKETNLFTNHGSQT